MRLCRTNQHTGLHSESEHFSIPLGTRDGGITPSRSADIIPAGSLAKPFTAVGVMQLVERGLVELDDPIPPHIDTFLHAINGTTLEELWGPTVNNVTIRMLLNMRSCLAATNVARSTARLGVCSCGGEFLISANARKNGRFTKDFAVFVVFRNTETLRRFMNIYF